MSILYISKKEEEKRRERFKKLRPHQYGKGLTEEGRKKVSLGALKRRKHPSLSRVKQTYCNRKLQAHFNLFNRWQELLEEGKYLSTETIAMIEDYFEDFEKEWDSSDYNYIEIDGQKTRNYIPREYQRTDKPIIFL